MLTDIYDNVVGLIKSLPQFAQTEKAVDRYHGEFEEGFDWIPVLPAALLYISNSRPNSKAANAHSLRMVTRLTIFVADRIDSLELAEDVANIVDGEEFEIDQANYSVEYVSLEFYAYIKQVEIYKITIDVK